MLSTSTILRAAAAASSASATSVAASTEQSSLAADSRKKEGGSKKKAQAVREIRRLLPSGALIRLSSINTDVTNPLDNVAEWRGGRSLAKEEFRSGMLTSLRQSLIEEGEGANGNQNRRYNSNTNKNSNSLTVASSRYSAVVKCQPSDWQANELDMFNSVVTLDKRPKGMWMKVDKQHAIMVEVDSDESFADEKKRYDMRMANAGKYAPKLGILPKSTPILNFNMYREHHSMLNVKERLRYATRVSSEALSFCGEEEGCGGGVGAMDSDGTITQQGKALGVTKEFLPHASKHYGMFPLLFDPKHYEALPSRGSGNDEAMLFRTDTRGTLYRTVLRCSGLGGNGSGNDDDGTAAYGKHYGTSQSGVSSSSSPLSFAEIAEKIQRRGFLNYFPLSSFSVATNSFQSIAAAAGSGNFNKACAAFLQSYAESNPIFFEDYSRYVAAADETSVPQLVEHMIKNASATRSHHNLVSFLKDLRDVKDFSSNSAELQAMWERWVFQKPRYANAAVSFLWNAMASQRVMSGGGRRVLVGDIVYLTEEEYRAVEAQLTSEGPLGQGTRKLQKTYRPAHVEGIFSTSTERFYVTRIADDAQAQRFDVSRLVLPVCDQRFPEALLFPTSYGTAEVTDQLAEQQGLGWVTKGVINPDGEGWLAKLSAASSSSSTESARAIMKQMARGSRLAYSRNHLPLYRTVVAFPSYVELHSLYDPNSCASLKTDLFLLQERKPLFPTLFAPSKYDVDGKLSTQRIRTPSPYNNSPAFQEIMGPIIAKSRHIASEPSAYAEEDGNGKNDHTTFIAARLPRNSHMSSLLREHFDLRYGRFQDMLW